MDRETVIRNLAASYENAPHYYVNTMARKAGIGTMSWTDMCLALAKHDYGNWNSDQELVWGGDEFNAMESGPMEEPDPAVTNLKGRIMERWIGVTGGVDWHNGPTDEAAVARGYGAALAAVLDDVLHGGVVRGSNPYGIRTTSGWFIYEVILPEVLEHFFAKNAEYGDRHRSSKFGAAGEIVGIDRKVDKLIESLWKGKKLQFEQPKEMLWDVIGSALLALDLIAQQEAREGVPG